MAQYVLSSKHSARKLRAENALAELNTTSLKASARSNIGVPAASGGTLTSPTISAAIFSDFKTLAADFDVDSGTTGSTLTSLTGLSWTLVAGATYNFELEGPVTMTTNGGLSVAFKYTTLTLTSISVTSMQMTASAIAVATSTTTTDQTKFIDQKATAYTYIRMAGSLVVNAGGTLAVQAAQNTSHADNTIISKGFKARFIRTA